MGKKTDAQPAPPVDPVAQARANAQAQIEAYPGAAQAQYNVLTSPTYGLSATSNLYNNVYKQLNPELSNLQPALATSLLSSLNSPTRYTPEQQAAIDATRGTAQNNLVNALRNRANLGGGLYGGRSAAAEGRAVGDLQNQFTVEDINFQAQQDALTKQFILALLSGNPAPGVVSPQFQSPVASADTQFGGAVSQANATNQFNQQKMASQAALQSALFQALGGAAGAVGGAMFMKPPTTNINI